MLRFSLLAAFALASGSLFAGDETAPAKEKAAPEKTKVERISPAFARFLDAGPAPTVSTHSWITGDAGIRVLAIRH